MWKTGGVTYGRMVDNLSGTVKNSPQGLFSGHYSELRIPGSFQRNLFMVGLNGSKTYLDTAYCPKSSDRATFRNVILNIRF